MINPLGMWWLFRKESLRFLKVSVQTILAPLAMSMLYLLVFSSVLDEHITVYNKVSYNEFLLPGLVIMSIMQNSFANSSSSLIQSKMNGNIVFMLLSPLSSMDIFIAYTLAAILRGFMVGLAILLFALLIFEVHVFSLGIILFFSLSGAAFLGILGIISGIVADKYDHLSAFQNFIIMPLTFLSGVFYSIESLSTFWQTVSAFNPMFYLIDGFRYGFLGYSDMPVHTSILVASAFVLVVATLSIGMLKTGYKLRN